MLGFCIEILSFNIFNYVCTSRPTEPRTVDHGKNKTDSAGLNNVSCTLFVVIEKQNPTGNRRSLNWNGMDCPVHICVDGTGIVPLQFREFKLNVTICVYFVEEDYCFSITSKWPRLPNSWFYFVLFLFTMLAVPYGVVR